MLEDTIMNILSDTAEHEIIYVVNNCFSKIKDDEIYSCQGSLQYYAWKKKITDTKKLRSYNFMVK